MSRSTSPSSERNCRSRKSSSSGKASSSSSICSSETSSCSYTQDTPIIHDVLIIGAGPCGLAVAARLKEPLPSAIFTDEEHSRYHWIKKHTGKLSVKNWRNGAITKPKLQTKTQDLSMLVLDKDGDQWMSKWNRLFKLLEIEHLRSPMFFHIDPGERDALVAFTQEGGRAGELKEIVNCVGKERSKHSKKKTRRAPTKFQEPAVDERDRRDYFTPSSKLFTDQCESIVGRYGLKETPIKNATLLDVDYEYFDSISASERIFKITTDQGLHFAKTVVMAVGAANGPTIPANMNAPLSEGQCHAMTITKFPDPSLQEKIRRGKKTTILVIGGGLTAAQIVDNALRHGVSKVYMLMRSGLKVKPFDVSLDWVGKFKNVEHSAFWSADTDEERLAMIQQARNGGSITPTYHKRLKSHITSDNLSLHAHTTLASQHWASEHKTWTITTSPPIDNLPQFDYVYHSTGIQTSISDLPYLQTMRQKFPVEVCGGLPCLTDDLMWTEDVPLFFTGKCAGLKLGPGAGNLAGARAGAERIAWKIEELAGCGAERDDRCEAFSGNRYQCFCGTVERQ